MVNAQVLTRPREFEMQSFQRPRLGATDGLLEIAATGLCGSDVASFTGSVKHDGPTVLGHEVIGTIAELGPQAARDWGVEVGDRVAIEEGIPCMACPQCRAGRHRMCSRTGLRYGYTSVDTQPSLWGGFAELMYLHPKTQLHRVPDEIDDATATLFIPLSNGLAWTRDLAELRPGESVAVFGAGQHGLACALAAVRSGAKSVVLVGLEADRGRLALAEEFGCLTLMSDTTSDLEADIRSKLEGPANVVIDMTPGAGRPLEQGITLAAPGGRVLWGGMKHRPGAANIDSDLVIRKELTIRGVWARASWAIPAAFEWLIQDPRLKRLTQATYAVENVADAFADATQEEPALRPLHAVIVNTRHYQ